eukprot:SAG25_NODE_36_length_19907_cov_10.787027_3_plen_853_part_00
MSSSRWHETLKSYVVTSVRPPHSNVQVFREVSSSSSSSSSSTRAQPPARTAAITAGAVAAAAAPPPVKRKQEGSRGSQRTPADGEDRPRANVNKRRLPGDARNEGTHDNITKKRARSNVIQQPAVNQRAARESTATASPQSDVVEIVVPVGKQSGDRLNVRFPTSGHYAMVVVPSGLGPFSVFKALRDPEGMVSLLLPRLEKKRPGTHQHTDAQQHTAQAQRRAALLQGARSVHAAIQRKQCVVPGCPHPFNFRHLFTRGRQAHQLWRDTNKDLLCILRRLHLSRFSDDGNLSVVDSSRRTTLRLSDAECCHCHKSMLACLCGSATWTFKQDNLCLPADWTPIDAAVQQVLLTGIEVSDADLNDCRATLESHCKECTTLRPGSAAPEPKMLTEQNVHISPGLVVVKQLTSQLSARTQEHATVNSHSSTQGMVETSKRAHELEKSALTSKVTELEAEALSWKSAAAKLDLEKEDLTSLWRGSKRAHELDKSAFTSKVTELEAEALSWKSAAAKLDLEKKDLTSKLSKLEIHMSQPVETVLARFKERDRLNADAAAANRRRVTAQTERDTLKATLEAERKVHVSEATKLKNEKQATMEELNIVQRKYAKVEATLESERQATQANVAHSCDSSPVPQLFDSQAFLARFMAFRQYVEVLLKYMPTKTARTKLWKLPVHRNQLCHDVLCFFSLPSFTKQKLFQRTQVTMIDRFGTEEDGIDQGGLTVELYGTFFREVLLEKVGLFESAGSDDVSSGSVGLLPKAQIDSKGLEALAAVGRVICKCLLDDQPLGRGLGQFVFEYLVDMHEQRVDRECHQRLCPHPCLVRWVRPHRELVGVRRLRKRPSSGARTPYKLEF